MPKSQVLKRFFLIVALLLLLTPVAGGVINYSGYCFTEKRYLSEHEKITAAVTYIINRMGAYPQPVIAFSTVYYADVAQGDIRTRVRVKRWAESPLIYSSVDELYRQNEGCCELVPQGTEGYRPSIWHRLSGKTSVLVRVKYSVRFVDFDENMRTGKINAYLPVSNCGVVWSGT